MANHEAYMARALQLAEQGLFTADPNPRVGCVVVKNDVIIGEGWHQKAGQGHAEVNALKDAGAAVYGADCYVSLEPCSHFGRTPPCADSLIKAGIKRVFIAMTDPNPLVSGQGIEKLNQAGIKTTVGILEAQAEKLNIGFCKRMRTGRPFVRSKIAMSLDGRTAMASGESKWITGAEARADVQKLRARSSAMLTGVGTVLADDPSLTVRPEGDWYPSDIEVRQPLRVVVDSHGRTPLNAKLLTDNNSTLIVTSVDNKQYRSAQTLCLTGEGSQVDLPKLMDSLGEQGLNEVMVEAGSTLNGALLAAGLIDEFVFYLAPKLMGNNAKALFDLPEITQMADAIELTITDIRQVGKDWRITATPEYKEV